MWQLGDDFLEVMSDVLHELPNIEHLNLASNKLSDEAMEKLVVVGNMGSSQSLHSILELLYTDYNHELSLSQVQSVKLCWCRQTVIEKKVRLKSLNFSRNKIDSTTIGALQRLIETRSSPLVRPMIKYDVADQVSICSRTELVLAATFVILAWCAR